MTDIPSPLTYATIVGTFISIGADTADGGSAPDTTTLNGTVTFTPNAQIFKTTTGTPVLAFAETITGRIIDGVLYAPDGVTALRVLATNSPGIDPTDFQYTATFKITNAPKQPTAVTFSAAGGSTVNLPSVVSAAPAPPTSSTYVTTADLNTALTSYVTSTNLTTILSGYVTTAALTTALGSYALSSTVTTLSGTVTTISAAVDLLSTRFGGASINVWTGSAFKTWLSGSFSGSVRTAGSEIRIFISTSAVITMSQVGYNTSDLWFAHEDQP